MITRVIIELEIEGNGNDVGTAVERVLDAGTLQDGLAEYAEDHGEDVLEVTSCVSHVIDGLPTRAIPGHVIASAIIDAWTGGAFHRHQVSLADREERTIRLAEAMVGGLSREDIIAIARKEARLAGDTRVGLTLERTQ